MPTSPEGFSKTQSQLRREDKTLLEQDCVKVAEGFRSQFKSYLREGHTYIVPVAIVYGLVEGAPSMAVIPFTQQATIPGMVSVLAAVSQHMKAEAFVVVYDGYTGGVSQTEQAKYPRKDSIISVWKTLWGSGEAVAIRYSKGTVVEFEPPMELHQMMGSFDAVFPVSGTTH